MIFKYVAGGIIIVVFIVWGALAFMKTTQYVSLEDAAKGGRFVQVMGQIDRDSVRYDADRTRLEFSIYDAEAEDKTVARHLAVVYSGTVPGNFDQATSVVLKGQMGGEGRFVADEMYVKCPSKYQGEGEEGYQDVRKHNPAAGGV